MYREVGRVRSPAGFCNTPRGDHHYLLFAVIRGQPGQHLYEDALITPPRTAVVQSLVWEVFLERVTPR